MLLDSVVKDSTDYSVTIRIIDSTDGTPETGVVFNTTGIDLWYRRPAAAHSSITEVTQTEGGAHTDGGFVHISDGYYRLDLPDAAVATGADYVDVGGTVTGMIVLGGRIRLVDDISVDSNGRVELQPAQPAVTFTSMTITGTFDINDGIEVSRSTSNQPAIVATGNGSGDGMSLTGGTTGRGLDITASGNEAMRAVTSSGSNNGVLMSAQGVGSGLRCASTSGAGLEAAGSGTNDFNGTLTGDVTGSVGSNLELGPSEVNAEVVDALNVDTYSEPGQGAPGVSISLAQKISYLYKAWRNRSTQTSTDYSLYADDGTTVDQTATVSDNGTTADKSEVVSGP